MTLTPVNPDIESYPVEFHSLLRGAKLYDSSCSEGATVVFIDRDEGFFLKSAPKGLLEREAAMTR
jgi:kanamycin kinase